MILQDYSTYQLLTEEETISDVLPEGLPEGNTSDIVDDEVNTWCIYCLIRDIPGE